jgi:hypothetical protein
MLALCTRGDTHLRNRCSHLELELPSRYCQELNPSAHTFVYPGVHAASCTTTIRFLGTHVKGKLETIHSNH